MLFRVKLFWVWLVLLFALVAYSGCDSNSTYLIKVTAVQDPKAEELESYTIRSSDAEVNRNDIWSKETEAYVKKVLAEKGFYEAPSPENADLSVDIAFGVNGPLIEIEEREIPVYVQMSDGIQEITVMVNDGAGGQIPNTRQVYTNPEQRIVGYEKQFKRVTHYQKFLRITAQVNHPGQNGDTPAYAWSVYITNKDKSNDIRKYLPVLAAAAVRYIGETTNDQVEIRLNEKDEVVEFIKNES